MRVLSLLVVVWLVTACAAGAPASTPTLVPPTEPAEAEPTVIAAQPTAPVSSVSETTAAPEIAVPTVPPTVTVRVWMPEPLAPIDNADAAEQLVTLIAAFESANPDIRIDLRLRASGDYGGQEAGSMLAALRSAAAVAPGALPDLTLLRRADLLAAEAAGITRPLDSRVPEVVRDDLASSTLLLGQLENVLIALPFMIDIKHMAYDPALGEITDWSFDSLLTDGFSYVFPAGRANNLSDTFLVQYLAAGGAFSTDGQLSLEPDALRTVFRFYEQALEDNILDSEVAQFTTSGDYFSDLVAGELTAGVVTSTEYLLLGDAPPLAYGLLPTSTGQPITVLDGWSWVLTTADSARENAAMRFLNYLYEVDRHSAYARAIGMIPSQSAALRAWADPTSPQADYIAFVETLIQNAVIQPDSFNTTARAIQSAFTAVITGQRGATDAVRDVITQAGS